MADILIRGMEMPTNQDVTIRIDPSGEVYVYDTYPTLLLKAITLPEGHGNLIDINAPIRVAYFDGTIHETTVSRILCKHSLLDLPKTIVPAEGGGEDG